MEKVFCVVAVVAVLLFLWAEVKQQLGKSPLESEEEEEPNQA